VMRPPSSRCKQLTWVAAPVGEGDEARAGGAELVQRIGSALGEG
jgi:hypothetical protein